MRKKLLKRNDGLVTVTAFAQDQGMSRNTVYQLIHERKLPVKIVGGHRFIDTTQKKQIREALLGLKGSGNWVKMLNDVPDYSKMSDFEADSERRWRKDQGMPY